MPATKFDAGRLPTGTSANQIVQLDSNGRIPEGLDALTSPINTITWSSGGTINYSLGNVFSLNVNGTGTLAESNKPASGKEYIFRLNLTLTSGTFTKPASWSKGMAIPSAAGTYFIQGRTTDGGTSFDITVGY